MEVESIVKNVSLQEEMKGSYLAYAMSVIVSRALPDVRDGLKPVQRRILYSMSELGLRHNTAFKKSARIVGEVMGKYHPHGDSSVYEAMVRLAQDFSMRYPLVDGQGNFGSVDDDPPAAMRYTEARLTQIAEEMLIDIDKDTVDFIPNFDDSLKEPSILPGKIPNLLMNGSAGIAVGMACNIPPHNLVELCDAIAHLIDYPEATLEELMQFIQGPDFPTRGIIQGREGIRNYCTTGQGKIVVRAKIDEGTTKTGRNHLIVSELPYQVNKATLVAKIAQLARDKKIEGISEVRDESDRRGIRMVIELKREAQPAKVINNLYKHTSMQTSFFVNMVALVDGQPRTINVREALTSYIQFRHQVITRRSKFELQKAKDRAHILEGLRIALDHLDRIIKTIRESDTAEAARTNLMQNFGLSQIQAQAILDMQLRRLAGLERQKINDEYTEVVKTIAYLEDLLANPRKIQFLIKQDAAELRAKYKAPRVTTIVDAEVSEFREEDLIPHQAVVVTLSNQGYIKRIPLGTYRPQRRGGKGVIGMVTRESDMVKRLVVCDTHDDLLFFTNRGKVYRLKCYDIPQDVSRTTKGTNLVNLMQIEQKEQVNTILPVSTFAADRFLVMITSGGEIKKTALKEFASVRSSGLIAMDPKGPENLIVARLVDPTDQLILITQQGKAIRFNVAPLRQASRRSGGVRGIRLNPGDQVVAMDVVKADAYVLSVTANGSGKLTLIDHFPVHHRGGKGVRSYAVNAKTGKVVAARLVFPDQDLVVMSTSQD
jgi:DNA gyrase subunit A